MGFVDHCTQKNYRIDSQTISVREFHHRNERIEFPKQFGKRFGTPLLTLQTNEFQKKFGSVITKQELPKNNLKLVKVGSSEVHLVHL